MEAPQFNVGPGTYAIAPSYPENFKEIKPLILPPLPIGGKPENFGVRFPLFGRTAIVFSCHDKIDIIGKEFTNWHPIIFVIEDLAVLIKSMIPKEVKPELAEEWKKRMSDFNGKVACSEVLLSLLKAYYSRDVNASYEVIGKTLQMNESLLDIINKNGKNVDLSKPLRRAWKGTVYVIKKLSDNLILDNSKISDFYKKTTEFMIYKFAVPKMAQLISHYSYFFAGLVSNKYGSCDNSIWSTGLNSFETAKLVKSFESKGQLCRANDFGTASNMLGLIIQSVKMFIEGTGILKEIQRRNGALTQVELKGVIEAARKSGVLDLFLVDGPLTDADAAVCSKTI